MTISYGKGRVFHTTMGHDAVSVNDVGFVTTLNRGAEWAATGLVTIPIPSDFPTEDKMRKCLDCAGKVEMVHNELSHFHTRKASVRSRPGHRSRAADAARRRPESPGSGPGSRSSGACPCWQDTTGRRRRRAARNPTPGRSLRRLSGKAMSTRFRCGRRVCAGCLRLPRIGPDTARADRRVVVRLPPRGPAAATRAAAPACGERPGRSNNARPRPQPGAPALP